MKGRHQGDLVWRFQRAQECDARDTEAWLGARERATQIDAALARLRAKPVSLARVLGRRYGLVETLPEIRGTLRENAAVAVMTPQAAEWCERTVGIAPRARSHDVRDWLGVLCRRIQAREASGEDSVALDEIRRASETLVGEAERAYERAVERARGGGFVG